MKGVFITGTGTDVGKTFIAAGILYHLQKKHIRAGYFKPIATGGNGDMLYVAQILGDASLVHNCYLFKNPVSPHLAAKKEKKPILLEPILAYFETLTKQYDFLVVEGSGGVAVPIDDAGTLMVDVIQKINLPTILVGMAGLGTINHSLLSIHFLKSHTINVRCIVLNMGKKTEIEEENQQIIQHLSKIPVSGILPFYPDANTPLKAQQVMQENAGIFENIVSSLEREEIYVPL
ncbi:MAG: dethiobiotin synthase [Brevinematales bacterium]|nr:dethiobiotin synthase [Brevinematales bacterium]